MGNWRDIRRQARATVQAHFGVPAIYMTHAYGTPKHISVRIHDPMTAPDPNIEGGASLIQMELRLVFDLSQIGTLADKAMVFVSETEVYRVNTPKPPRENFQESGATRLSKAEAEAAFGRAVESGSGITWSVTPDCGCDDDEDDDTTGIAFMSANKLEMKQGASFDLTGYAGIGTTSGTVRDFTGWAGEADIKRANGVKVEDLIFEWVEIAAGQLRIRSTDTSEWPVECLQFDIRLSKAGQTLITQTGLVDVQRSITNGA